MTRLADQYAQIREQRDKLAARRCGDAPDGEHDFSGEALAGFNSQASGDFRVSCQCGAMEISWPRGLADAWTVTIGGESFGPCADIGEAMDAWRRAHRR